MGHTLFFNFVFDREQSKEDFLNRILTFLKGFDAEQLFNTSYHPQLEEEIDLMDEVPQNSIKHIIRNNLFAKWLLLAKRISRNIFLLIFLHDFRISKHKVTLFLILHIIVQSLNRRRLNRIIFYYLIFK